MEWLVSFMNNVLGLKARHGWIFLLAGGTMLLILYYGILPSSEIGGGVKAVFTFAVVIGIVTLIVSAGATGYQRLSANAAAKYKAQAERDRQAAIDADAVKTAEVLTGRDAGKLLELLSQPNKRSTDPNLTSLFYYHLVRPVNPSGTAHEVVESVWNERDRLIPILKERAQDRI